MRHQYFVEITVIQSKRFANLSFDSVAVHGAFDISFGDRYHDVTFGQIFSGGGANLIEKFVGMVKEDIPASKEFCKRPVRDFSLLFGETGHLGVRAKRLFADMGILCQLCKAIRQVVRYVNRVRLFGRWCAMSIV